MAAQEVTLKFRGDESQIKASLAGLRTAYSATISDITKQTKAEAQLTATLQRQRVRDTKTALADIARLERERLQIMAQNERAMERLAKQEADSRIREARRAANEFLRLLKQQAAEAAAAARQARSSISGGANTVLAGAAGGVAALLGVSAISEIRQAGQAWLDYSNKLQTTQIAFTTMMGSAQLAQDHLKELQQFALKTPFQFAELIDASQRMQALGFRAEQVIPILTDVGNAVAAAGGGSERLDRVTLALSQIQSKGKVMTQELNQLAEAGIPAFKILQQELGKSRSEINDLTKDGQISSKVFLDAFQKFSQQNFGGLMEAQSRTFSGAMSNIKDALLQTSSTAFAPLFEKLTQTAVYFSEASQSSKDFQKNLQTVGNVSATIFDGLVEAVTAFRDAIRIVAAAITGEITFVVETLKSGAHLSAAILNEAFGTIEKVLGHAATAAKLHQAAQEELRQGAIASKKAFDAQANTVKTIIAVYREAEERAKALANAQAKVGVDIGLAPEFQKGFKRPSAETEDDPAKKKKGSDPAAAAKRVAEIQLRAVLDGIQLEEEGIERSLRKRLIQYRTYESQIKDLEEKRTQAVLAGLRAEERAANELRDPNAKAVALAEIEARRTQENNKHQSEIDKRTDASEAHKRKQFEATTDVLRETISAQLKIAGLGDEQRITAIQALADARVKTEEQAEREILKIRLAAIDREKERLTTEVATTTSIQDPEEELKTRAKLNLQIKVLAEERKAIEQDAERDIEAARRRDLENERKYANELKTIKQQVLNLQRSNAQAVIDSMVRHFASRRSIVRAQLELDKKEERSRHEQALETIRGLEQENRESKRTAQEKLEAQQEINRLREAEAERHRLEMKRIQEDQDAVGPPDISIWRQFGLELKEILKSIRADMLDFADFMGGTFKPLFLEMRDALKEGIVGWLLYGESLAKALRKALAASLAHIAADAAIQALYHAAFAIGSLAFGDFGSAAKHAIAAAQFAAVAAAAGLGARAVAGNAFSSSVGGGSGGSNGSGSSPRSQATGTTPRPVEIDRSRNDPIRAEIVLKLSGGLEQVIEGHVVKNWNSNGRIRTVIQSDGQG